MHHVFKGIPQETPRCGSRRHLDATHVPTVRPGYLLCGGCLESVENVLVDLPDWYTERVRRARGSNRPLRPDVVTVVSDVVAVFSSWTAVVVSQRGLAAPEPPTVLLLAGFLEVHLQWLTARPTAAEFADDLMFLEQAVRTVMCPESALPAPLGPCPWPNCGKLLYALARESAVDQQITCASGHRWPPDQWLTLTVEPSETDNRGDGQNPAGGNREVA
jgi:hypothetical protein